MFMLFRYYYSVMEMWGPFESEEDAQRYRDAVIAKMRGHLLYESQLMSVQKLDHHIDGVPGSPLIVETNHDKG